MASTEEKKLLRQRFSVARKKLDSDGVRKNGEKILEKLFLLKEFQSAKSIATFVDFENEPPTKPVIEKALEMGKTVLVPRTNSNEKTLSFHAIQKLSELKPNKRGILEPSIEKTELKPHEIDLVLVPGLVFDENGHRLGSGQGYFDRVLPKMKKAFRIGLAFEEFVIAKLPAEAHDAKMDALITEKKPRFFGLKH